MNNRLHWNLETNNFFLRTKSDFLGNAVPLTTSSTLNLSLSMVSTYNLIRTLVYLSKAFLFVWITEFLCKHNLMSSFFRSITFYAVAQLESKYIHIFSNPELKVKVRPRAPAHQRTTLQCCSAMLITQVDFAIQFADDVALYSAGPFI